MRIELVTRAGCHLCVEAEAALRVLGLTPELRDVDADAELSRLYDFRVPVVLVDGRVAAEGRIDAARLRSALGPVTPVVMGCGAEAAPTVHELTQAAFAMHVALVPASGALEETLERVRADLEAGGGALASVDGRPVGCLRFEDRGDHLLVRRVAVRPAFQGRGVGRALMAWAEAEAVRRRREWVKLGVRRALTGNLAFYQRLGYALEAEHHHAGFTEVTWYTLAKRVAAAG